MSDRGFEETRGQTGFSGLAFIRVHVLKSQGDERVPIQRRGKQSGRSGLRGDEGSFGSSLGLHGGCCAFSLQTFAAHFFLGLRHSSGSPPKKQIVKLIAGKWMCCRNIFWDHCTKVHSDTTDTRQYSDVPLTLYAGKVLWWWWNIYSVIF